MTMKEVETVLDIPRATVRFYEKEGLLDPKRGSNGYRDYSSEDIDRLKKIIILRKIGLSVNDIEALIDGTQTLPNMLDANIIALQKKMDELNGAMNLSRQMRNDLVEFASLDSGRYWNIIEEEEKCGSHFSDIAKDIVQEEKKIIFSYLGWTDEEGNLYDVAGTIRKLIIIICISGSAFCLIQKEWSIYNFIYLLRYILPIIIVECVLSIPLYFLGKKIPWVAQNREKAMVLTAIILCGFLVIFAKIMGE